MTIPPTEIDVREEIDILSVDPLFIERQRNRYASRAVAYVVWLNGLAALALLLGFAHATIPPDNAKRFADAMLVFGAGAVAGLGSAFFAYVGRTFRIERPYLASWRRPLRWLAILAAVAGAVCFIRALNMVRVAVLPKEAPAAASTAAPQPEKHAKYPKSLIVGFRFQELTLLILRRLPISVGPTVEECNRSESEGAWARAFDAHFRIFT